MELIQSISTKDPNKNKPGRGNANISTKVLEEVEVDIVDYEPWMDDYGRKPEGVTFSEKEAICKANPEIWLDPDECKDDDDTPAPPKPIKEKEIRRRRARRKVPPRTANRKRKGKRRNPKRANLPHRWKTIQQKVPVLRIDQNYPHQHLFWMRWRDNLLRPRWTLGVWMSLIWTILTLIILMWTSKGLVILTWKNLSYCIHVHTNLKGAILKKQYLFTELSSPTDLF